MNFSGGIPENPDSLTLGVDVPRLSENAARYIERHKSAIVDDIAVRKIGRHIGIEAHDLVSVRSRAVVHRCLDVKSDEARRSAHHAMHGVHEIYIVIAAENIAIGQDSLRDASQVSGEHDLRVGPLA